MRVHTGQVRVQQQSFAIIVKEKERKGGKEEGSQAWTARYIRMDGEGRWIDGGKSRRRERKERGESINNNQEGKETRSQVVYRDAGHDRHNRQTKRGKQNREIKVMEQPINQPTNQRRTEIDRRDHK